MSTQRIKSVSRTLSIASFSQAGTVLTIEFASTHFLKIADQFTIFSDDSSGVTNLVVATIVNPTTITVTVSANYTWQNITGATVNVPYYSAGQTGAQPMFTFPLSQATGIVQFIANGTGGAVFTLTASAAKDQAPITLANFTLASINNATDYLAITVPWPYLGINITSIGSNTTLTVLRST